MTAKVGAIAFIVFGFGFLPQVVLFVGQMLVSDGALDYFTDNAEVLWQVPVAVAVLAIYCAAIGVALASLTDRRIVGGVAILGVALITSAVAAIIIEAAGDGGTLAVVNVLALPLDLRDLVFLGHLSDDSGLSGVSGGGVLAVLAYLLVLRVGHRRAAERYREGGAVTPPAPVPVPAARAAGPARSGVRGRRHRDRGPGVGVVRAGVALTELSCSFGPGVTGLLGLNGAGKTTLMRALTGLLPLNEGRVEVMGGDPHRDLKVSRSSRSCPRTRPCHRR